MLDLEDAFFPVPLSPESQEPFAFEWEDTDLKGKDGSAERFSEPPYPSAA